MIRKASVMITALALALIAGCGGEQLSGDGARVTDEESLQEALNAR